MKLCFHLFGPERTPYPNGCMLGQWVLLHIYEGCLRPMSVLIAFFGTCRVFAGKRLKIFIWRVMSREMDGFFLYILSIRPVSCWTRINCKIMKNKDCIRHVNSLCQFAEVVLRRNSMTRYDKDLCGPVHRFSSTPIRLVWVKALSFSEQVLVD